MPPGAPDRDRFDLPGLVLRLALRFDQDLQGSPHELAVLAQRNRLLGFHDRVAPLFGDLGGNRCCVERGRFRARFRGIGEDPDMVEGHLLDKAKERLELGVGFAWVADDQGRAHRHIGQGGPRVIDQAACHVDAARPVHAAQDVAVRVLDRHVQVRQEGIMLGHHIDHAQGERARVDIEEPQPGQVRDLLDDHLQQLGEPMLHAEVGTVANRVLGHEHHLFGAAGHDIDDLLDHVERPLADLPPFDTGDRAEGAVVVAAVGHFDVGGGAGIGAAEGGQHPLAASDFGLSWLAEQITDDVADLVPLAGRQHAVNTCR